MRVSLPFENGVPAVELAPSPQSGRGNVVTVSNTGPNPVWIADNGAALDASLGQGNVTPNYGIELAPGVTIATIITTGLWGRADLTGSFLDIFVGDICVE